MAIICSSFWQLKALKTHELGMWVRYICCVSSDGDMAIPKSRLPRSRNIRSSASRDFPVPRRPTMRMMRCNFICPAGSNRLTLSFILFEGTSFFRTQRRRSKSAGRTALRLTKSRRRSTLRSP